VAPVGDRRAAGRTLDLTTSTTTTRGSVAQRPAPSTKTRRAIKHHKTSDESVAKALRTAINTAKPSSARRLWNDARTASDDPPARVLVVTSTRGVRLRLCQAGMVGRENWSRSGCDALRDLLPPVSP